MLKEFKAFAMRGNVIDLAVAVIVGGAFGKIVTSLVNDVIMPPIGLILGGVNFSNLFFNLSGRSYQSLAEAKATGAPTINYGLFLNTVIDFLIVSFVMFLVIRTMSRIGHLQAVLTPVTPEMKDCPQCLSRVPARASRCAHCTSDLRTP